MSFLHILFWFPIGNISVYGLHIVFWLADYNVTAGKFFKPKKQVSSVLPIL